MISVRRTGDAGTRRFFHVGSRMALLAATALVVLGGGPEHARAQSLIDGGSVVNVPGTEASPWNLVGPLTVGGSGNGTLNIGAGGLAGAVTNTAAELGHDAGSNGVITVTGASSTWTTSGVVTVGHEGTGSLSVTGGSIVNANGVYVGLNEGSSGTVTIGGTNTIFTSGSFATVGYSGTGTLTVSDGAHANTDGAVIGLNADSNGTATITGTGSVWTIVHDLAVGDAGTGGLTVSDGGSIISEASSLGYYTAGYGAATVTGAGSSWANSKDLHVGEKGTGSLTIADGGVVSNANGYISYNGVISGLPSIVKVTGAGSTWTNSADLYVGLVGSGALNIEAGGKVTAANAYVGGSNGGQGIVEVDGAGSSLGVVAELNVGYVEAGSLTISNGGAVTSVGAAIGYGGTALGSATVDGTGSTWTNTSSLFVGYYGTGTLEILDGGSVGSVAGYVGLEAGSTGGVTVDGAGSTWTNDGVVVGYSGTGTLTISNGGVVGGVAGNAVLGTQAGASGTASVDGSNSKWTVAENLSVGSAGTGALTISSGGLVSVAGVVGIADGLGSVGTLNIGAAAGSTAAAAGTLAVTNVTFGDGTGAINFNHTGTNYDFTPAIAGVGTINQLAGTTVLSANSASFTGATNVSGGRLAVNGSLAGSIATVSGGGILGGTGTVGGIIANAGGIVGPGNSIGTLNVSGDTSFADGSIYRVEANDASQSDKIVATGTATINGGTVQVVVEPGAYAPSTDYVILTANGGRSGTFDAVTSNLAFYAPSLTYDPNNVYLKLTRNSLGFAAIGETPNQIATGGGVGSLGSGNTLYDAVLGFSTDEVRDAFDQLSGEVHASARGAMIEDSRFPREAALDRLRAAATADRPAVWGRGVGAWGRSDGDGNAARIDRSTGAIFIGADAALPGGARAGIVAGYRRTTFDVTDRRSSGASDNYDVGLYGGATFGDLTLRTGAAYTWHDVSTSRSVEFPGVTDRLTGNYNAGTAQVFGELGYGMRAGKVALEPFANLAYVSLHADGFTEKGGPAALTGAGAVSDATFTALGLRASTGFTIAGVNATAEGMLGWRHVFGDAFALSTMRFAEGGDAFSIGGAPVARDAAVAEAGLNFAITPAATLGVSLSGQFGPGFSDQSANADFNVKF
ncbi:MAG: autotransporter domain-containing protein [Bauldia sp.]